MLREASEELPDAVRLELASRERRQARLWQLLEWLGIGLILLGMFEVRHVIFSDRAQNVFSIAGGLALFCVANAASAWSAYLNCKKLAPGTRASNTGFRAALLVTVAEIVLLAVVCWRVYSRYNWSKWLKPKDESGEVIPEEKGTWLDETIALKELSKLDRDYITGLVEGGALRTKIVSGKKMYNARDVEALKNKKQEVLPE